MTQPLFAAVSADVARVALPVPADEIFDYAVPERFTAEARVGCRVQVPFGGRTLTGVIVERGSVPRFEGTLRPLRKIIDADPVLSVSMIAILREEATEVLCPVGLALAAAIPAGSAPRIERGLGLTPRGRAALEAGALTDETRPLLESLRAAPRTTSVLRRRFGADALDALEADGLVAARVVERAPSARAARVRVARVADGVSANAAAEGPLARAQRQAELLLELERRGPTPVAALRRTFSTAPVLLRELAKRNLVSLEEREVPRDVLGAALQHEPEVTPTPDQSAVLKPIREAIDNREARTFLLHGITGSGKTEVYLRAVGEALATGRQALVLVPEITLTHQILARLRSRFGDEALAVLHSGLKPGERVEQWGRLRAGATPIAVGARSALFAPLEDLGVIVIDEEHDGAYKNDEGFRYHARDLGRRRAQAAACPLILGSATPALETRHAADRGELERLVLSARIGSRALPSVEIVDLQRERDLAPRGRKVILSRLLTRSMRENLAEGGQTILLLNRRGFSTQILCFSCGHAEACPNCDIALVYHATEQQMRCHYCDHTTVPPEACGECGAPDTALLGLGTERLEEEVRAVFPGARIARLDRDTAQRRGHTMEVLRGIRAGELDIVIGTQMVAKGHDFPGVRLVGVVLADIGLHLPDFRAAERTFQLLTQVAGRAGRDRAPGRVVIQTYSPQHYAIQPVRSHDYEGFYAEELGHRSALGYPPFGSLVHALVSGPDADATLAATANLASDAGPEPGVDILGPAPAPLSRLRGRHRFQILAKGADAAAVRRVAVRLRLGATRLPDDIQASVDPRPINMM